MVAYKYMNWKFRTPTATTATTQLAGPEAMTPVPDHILLRPNEAGNWFQGEMLAFSKTNTLIGPR
jgi:hypothetical protein